MLALLLVPGLLWAQAPGSGSGDSPSQPVKDRYPGELLPPGLRELDRAKTLLIGAFPFAYLLSGWGFDFYYYASRDFDPKFTPWPMGVGTASLTGEELQNKYRTLVASSLILSGGLALLDFVLGLLEPPPGPMVEPPDADTTPDG